LICIAKGGLRVGDVFSRLFNVPLAILSVESYHGSSDDIKNQQGQFTFSRDLAKTTPNLGSHILLVDDLADSGKTLIKSIKWLEHFYGFYLEEKIKTAVIWHKSTSKFKPDYAVDYLEDSPWIHMPFEKYETTNIKDFKFD
jgi:Predicted phosphoribosyltransferases